MRWLPAFVIVILAAGVLPADEAKDEWVKVADKDKKFEAQFPAKPTSGRGNTQYLLTRAGGKVALLVQFDDFPKTIDISDAKLVKHVMDAGRDAILKKIPASKLISEKEVTFAGKYPGRDIDIDYPMFGIYRVRFIVAPMRFYQVTILGPKDYQDSAEAKKFMDSFKLTE